MTEADGDFATKEEALAALAARLKNNPDGILESLAKAHGVSMLEATRLLPTANRSFAPASAFTDIMHELADWGDVTVVVHTANIVLEARGPLPKGEHGHGYFNLHGDSPIGGHIKANRCASIAFVRRPFMGEDSCSTQFFDEDGAAMFKVFVVRRADYSLEPDQVAKFESLRARFGRPQSE